MSDVCWLLSGDAGRLGGTSSLRRDGEARDNGEKVKSLAIYLDRRFGTGQQTMRAGSG